VVLPPRHGLSLCSGGGGLDMGLDLAEPGFATACFVEWEEYPRSVLIAAQRAGYFAPAPIWDNVKTFDGRPWRGLCDTVLAGYPCQPFSAAGQRKGEDDPRHLWPDVARIIGEVQPEWVFLENVPGHVSLGLETVLRALWDMGFTPAVGLFSAAEIGAPHERLRVFIVAHRNADADARGLDRRGTDSGTREGESQGWKRERLRSGVGGGSGHVDNPTSPRCDGTGIGPGSNIESRERLSGDGRDAMADASVTRSADGGQPGQPAPTAEDGSGLVAEPERSGGDMADTSGPEREGQQRGQHHARGRQVKDGHPALSRGTGIFPPGPSDSAAWSETLAVAPDLAPAAGLADCLAWAGRLAASLDEPGESAAQSRIRGLADGLASRSRALRLLGNGVVPLAAGYAWRTLSSAHGLGRMDLEAVDREDEAGAA